MPVLSENLARFWTLLMHRCAPFAPSANSSQASQRRVSLVPLDRRKYKTMSPAQNVKPVSRENSSIQSRPHQVIHVPSAARTRSVMRVLIIASHVHLAAPVYQARLVAHAQKDLEGIHWHLMRRPLQSCAVKASILESRLPTLRLPSRWDPRRRQKNLHPFRSRKAARYKASSLAPP
jgi:hypothetical protein